MVRRLQVASDNHLCPEEQPLMIEEKGQIAYQILEYLVDHPEAQDTLEGIVEWWLLERTIKSQTLSVREALGMLVAERLVIESKGKDARTHYRVNNRRREKIVSLLEQKYTGDHVA